jgi:hypothetical protein
MSSYVFLDLICLTIAFLLLTYKNALTFYHPGTIFLFYHIINNTLRFISVLNGANLAFTGYKFLGASFEELQRALFWSDIALLTSSIAIFLAQNKKTKASNTILPVNNRILKIVAFITMPIGFWAAISMLYIPNFNENFADFGEWSASSYLQITQAWFGLTLCGLIYFKGFKKKYVIPLAVYLVIIALQGGLRYRLILPVIFLVTAYLFRKGAKWPSKPQLIMLAACGILFYPLKIIGQHIREGGNIADIGTIISNSTSAVVRGNESDQVFLDQYAMTLTEIDRKEKIYFGSTITPVITLIIPRQIWPDKPVLNQWQVDISTSARPFDKIGSITTIYGEAYANFRYFGILFIPALVFYYITRWYKRILLKDMYDVNKFFYAVVFCCLIQVMRDGLISLFTFPILNSMPLFAMFILHKIFGKRDITQ